MVKTEAGAESPEDEDHLFGGRLAFGVDRDTFERLKDGLKERLKRAGLTAKQASEEVDNLVEVPLEEKADKFVADTVERVTAPPPPPWERADSTSEVLGGTSAPLDPRAAAARAAAARAGACVAPPETPPAKRAKTDKEESVEVVDLT